MPSFERRYVFTGHLIFLTALHIGGGRGTLAATDSPIIRGPDLKPFIPGSSLKGSFRSTVEKLAPSLNLSSCGLVEDAPCPGAPGLTQREFNDVKEGWDEAQLLLELSNRLCITCQLFGSPFKASKIYFDDLRLVDWSGATQVRDGVAIDRDSERAADRLKYDFEVVPPSATFDLRVGLEEPDINDLALTCLGLSEFVAGFCGIGGKRSRGLGRCELTNLKVYELDLTQSVTRATRLRSYLLGDTLDKKMTRLPDANAFLQTSIGELL